MEPRASVVSIESDDDHKSQSMHRQFSSFGRQTSTVSQKSASFSRQISTASAKGKEVSKLLSINIIQNENRTPSTTRN